MADQPAPPAIAEKKGTPRPTQAQTGARSSPLLNGSVSHPEAMAGAGAVQDQPFVARRARQATGKQPYAGDGRDQDGAEQPEAQQESGESARTAQQCAKTHHASGCRGKSRPMSGHRNRQALRLMQSPIGFGVMLLSNRKGHKIFQKCSAAPER